MFVICRWWTSMSLPLLLFLFLFGACSGDSSARPNPLGRPDGRPTLVYLWGFP